MPTPPHFQGRDDPSALVILPEEIRSQDGRLFIRSRENTVSVTGEIDPFSIENRYRTIHLEGTKTQLSQIVPNLLFQPDIRNDTDVSDEPDDSTVADFNKSIRFAIFCLHSPSPPQIAWHSLKDGRVFETPPIDISSALIVAIDRLPRLEYLNLQLESFMPTDVAQVAPVLAEAVINQCPRLEALQYYNWPDEHVPYALIGKSSLERLSLTLGKAANRVAVVPPSLQIANLESILRRHAFLTWLVLMEDPGLFKPDFSRAPVVSRYHYDNSIMSACAVLQQHSSLKRFACTLYLHAARALDYDLEDASPAEMDQWYMGKIRIFDQELPHLEQVCILAECPVIYQGTRPGIGEPMRIQKTEARRKDQTFPVGLFVGET
ncbi:hypothetical protein S40288_11231 [Stachybotrys chartarum IBT 40288]|nr:hypothetical protein S40288_11231 [Stachybotrys chartarum IBT 40288]